MIATIVGATGPIGSFLTQRLLADAAITEVIAISRRPAHGSCQDDREMVAGLSELPLTAVRRSCDARPALGMGHQPQSDRPMRDRAYTPGCVRSRTGTSDRPSGADRPGEPERLSSPRAGIVAR